jgi:hypothetical protein
MTKRQEIIKLLQEKKYTAVEIANKVGCSYKLVHNYRQVERIEKVSNWDKYEHLLGVMSDADLANMIGITTNAVTRKRLRSGILSNNDTRHSDIIKKYSEKLDHPSFEVKTTCGGRIDVLTKDKIFECKPTLQTDSVLQAIAQLFIYSIDYPFHKKVILTSKILCPSHILKSLDKLGIQIIIQKI